MLSRFPNIFSFIQIRQISSITALLILVGCASISERHPIAPDNLTKATITGIPDARFWGDEWPKFGKKIIDTFTDEQFRKNFPASYGKTHAYIAISGGGSNGAFGAGLLAGWTASGTRPEFNMVTGISTGALTAPFAFLGSEYDDELKKVYTTTTTKDIIEERNIISAVFGDSMADTKPLRNLIERYITPEIIEAIAKEHKRGRRLFVGTVNLDAGRSMIWNIGAIAASNSPRKLSLIYDVLQASAAIPIAFPPVMIQVDVDGKTFDEMHVDGGTGSQVFVYPAAVNWRLVTKKLKVQGAPRIYVIRNSFLNSDNQSIERSMLPIASRSIDSLIRTQGVGDMFQIYALCKRDGNDFNLAYIPSDFTEKPTEGFDPVYMTKLYNLVRICKFS
jgi:predicted acylesterase/phospholipase RssA